MRYQRIGFEIRDRVARLALSGRPLNRTEAREIDDAMRQVSLESDVRVVMLHTTGLHFAPGADDDLAPHDLEIDPAAAIADYPLPVVAALSGEVVSVGLEIALAADIRIADDSLAAAIPDVTEGVLPCWGGTQRLTRAVGPQNALWLLLMGASVNAQRALEIGLVQEVTRAARLETRVSELTRHLGKMSPLALRYLKEAVHDGIDLPLTDGMRLEGDLNTLLISSHDRQEGISAFFEKRPAEFEGR